MNKDDLEILSNILDGEIDSHQVHNIRKNGESISRYSNENVQIINKENEPGIIVNVKKGVKDVVVQIPVILTKEGFNDTVYNDFNIGEGSEVLIIAGCAIHNDCDITSTHSGIHTFNISKNAKVKYVEKHYGCGQVRENKIINTDTIIKLESNSHFEIETIQISGVDKANRKTNAVLLDDSILNIKEKLLTDEKDEVLTEFEVVLDGENAKTNISSRSIAKNNSVQKFYSNIIANCKSFGHVECDAIMMDQAKIESTPKVVANNVDALLSHEAAIGKINENQILKLKTLGLTEEEAVEEIIRGFMK